MNFYNSTHRHYCGIDLHARNLYVCILDQQGEALLHKEIPAKPEPLLHLIQPYLDNLIIGVECMNYWYWIADFCEDQGIAFILGYALYLQILLERIWTVSADPQGKVQDVLCNAIPGGKTKNDRVESYKIAALMRGGNFPLAYMYPRSIRATRDLWASSPWCRYEGSRSQYNFPPNKANLMNVSTREKLSRAVYFMLKNNKVFD